MQIPESHRQKDYPSYYRISQKQNVGRIVSQTLQRTPGCTNSSGLVYYPLGAPTARTGNLVSLNAPFEMDNNRANLVTPSSSFLEQMACSRVG